MLDEILTAIDQSHFDLHNGTITLGEFFGRMTDLGIDAHFDGLDNLTIPHQELPRN